jgi:hypothetical protein
MHAAAASSCCIAWHAHAGCACVHGGIRIDPDVNARQKAFQRVHDGGAPSPSSSGSWWPVFAPLCLTRAILSISTISKAHRQLVRRSILDADRPNIVAICSRSYATPCDIFSAVFIELFLKSKRCTSIKEPLPPRICMRRIYHLPLGRCRCN